MKKPSREDKTFKDGVEAACAHFAAFIDYKIQSALGDSALRDHLIHLKRGLPSVDDILNAEGTAA